MIKLNNVQFAYPDSDFYFHIDSLQIKQGEKVAIIGPSGSGKTTLLNLISGILTVSKGSVEVAEHAIHLLNDAQRRQFRISNIGFVFQDFELLDYLKVEDNILHIYRIHQSLTLNKQVKEKAKELAKSMGIASKLKRYPAQLSQGEKQRVAICRALLTSPSLILADEATGNLDPHNKEHILELLFEQASNNNATMIAVTHDHALLPHFDRVIDFQAFIKGRK